MHQRIPTDWNYKRTVAGAQLVLTSATHGRIDVYEKGKVLIKIAKGKKLLPLTKAYETAAIRNHRSKPNEEGVRKIHYVFEV